MTTKRVRNRKEYNRQFNIRHKERIKEQKHKYYLAHKEEYRLYRLQYYPVHKEAYALQAKKVLKEAKLAVFTHYASKKIPSCICCGLTDIDILAIDHINGGGNAHRKQLGKLGGYAFYRWLQKNNYPEGYQVLCFNCNMKKRMTERL